MAMRSKSWVRRGAILTLALAGMAGIAACGEQTRNGQPAADPRDYVRPNIYPALQGSIGEVAVLASNQPVRVNGYALVADLPHTGSYDAPPNIRQMLIDELYREGAGMHQHGTENIRPEAILSTDRVAVVQVYGSIPPLATKGTRFDLTLVALPGTQTTSLEHGLLWTTRLKIIGLADSDWTSRTLALGRGPTYVQRAASTAAPAQPGATQPATRPATTQWASAAAAKKVNLRRATVHGGGLVTEDRPVVLQLYAPSDRIASLIPQVINARFPAQPPYAAAQNSSVITVRVPAEYQSRPHEFVDVIMHLYLNHQVAGFVDKRADVLLAALADPKAPHKDIALALQGLGRTVVDTHLRPQYASPNPTVRFYAAKAGAAMLDVEAMVVLEDFANNPSSPYQREAITAIGNVGPAADTERATASLVNLLNAPQNDLRLAAYNALTQTGSPVVRHFAVPGKFLLDVVPSDGPTLIYATQTGDNRYGLPKIVLIGRQLNIAPGTLYVSPDTMLTINVPEGDEHADAGAAIVTPALPELAPTTGTDAAPAAKPIKDDDERVTIYFRGNTGDKAVTLKSPRLLPRLLARIAWSPNPMAKDYDPSKPYVGVSYQRCVEMLAGMCRDHCIDGTFILGEAPPMENTAVDLAETARPEGLAGFVPATGPATQPIAPPPLPGVPQ